MSATVPYDAFAALLSDPADGDLPDGAVPGSTGTDWLVVLGRARERGWRMTVLGTEPRPVPDDLGSIVADPDDSHTVAVWPAEGVQVNVFVAAGEVDFDVDRREITGQEPLDALCDFLRTAGTALGKDVTLAYEGSDAVFLTYDVAADAFSLAEPPR
ncbi:MAG TPA: hypothetical protein VNQ77_04825 [Frankiaceae bacterium]|nr:hypothetical protein [Frankiaceae bacterium]